MSWVNQPAGDRAATQPIDETFLDTWIKRYNAHRARPMPKWRHNESNTFGSLIWESSVGSTEIYIPPWADVLAFRANLSIVTSNQDPEVGFPGGTGSIRFLVGGTEYSDVASVQIGCKISPGGPPDFVPSCNGICPSCDGDETSSNVPFPKEALWTVLESMKDSVQTVSFETMRNVTNVTSMEYNRRDSSGGTKYLPWSWREAA